VLVAFSNLRHTRLVSILQIYTGAGRRADICLMLDVSVADIFFALTLCGCVCVPSETERLQDLANSILRFNAN
jgi:hypothetical protein